MTGNMSGNLWLDICVSISSFVLLMVVEPGALDVMSPWILVSSRNKIIVSPVGAVLPRSTSPHSLHSPI